MKKFFKYILIAFVVFLFIGFLASQSDKKAIAATDTTADSTMAPAELLGTGETTSTPVNWVYTEDEDKMDNKTKYFALCTSTNEIEFDFPYGGGSKMNITVRNMDGRNSVAFSVTKGQFMTSVMGDEVVRVKYDDEKPVTYSFGSASDGSSDVIFPSSSATILKKLKTAKTIMIEAPFFQSGRKQFEFDVSGLDWKH